MRPQGGEDSDLTGMLAKFIAQIDLVDSKQLNVTEQSVILSCYASRDRVYVSVESRGSRVKCRGSREKCRGFKNFGNLFIIIYCSYFLLLLFIIVFLHLKILISSTFRL